MKKPLLMVLSLICTLCACNGSSQANNNKEQATNLFSPLKWRSLGPGVTGGRISDIAVNANEPSEYYLATASGGVWKTVNAGTTWQAIFDNQNSYSIGDVTLDPNDSNVVWVGTGENNSQRSVGYGDGVYKSLDRGKTWQNMGLKDSEHIGKILIDPRNSQIIYVAAQGPLWRKGGDRGLYKSSDGGKTWEQSLTISEHTGVSDIAFEPGNPDVIYATSYQRRRHVWTLINGGPESSIHKSTDAGKTWQKIAKGLPTAQLGRIGIAVAPTAPKTIYAIVEAAEGKSGFYRSVNGGASWHKQSGEVSQSPQYYQEIVVDPNNPDRIYSLDTYLRVSDDAGKTFRNAGEKHKHVDNHALWINPQNSNHLLVGSDGGVYESWDRAKNWRFKENLPLTQFYRVTVDNDYPFYNIFGGTQDNASLGAPHRTTTTSGIQNSDWLYTQFGDGFKTAIDPKDPNIIYSQYQYGGLARYDKRSGEKVQIKPFTADMSQPQRFNWNSPLLISPHNHKRLYFASQTVFKSDDQGASWQAISGDLSRNLDRNKLEVMDTVWGIDTVAKNKSTSFYGSIVSLSESTLSAGLLFAGTDDGLMHRTSDNGKNWQALSWPRVVPENSYVSDLEPSLFDKNTVFATFDNHKKGDFKPYVFASTNQGKSWQNITGNLPERGTVYTLVQDHKVPELLFVGTEFGVFYTQDKGEKWHPLKSGIPTIAIRDLEIQRRESDLAAASFGRGFYILDDYSPLREAQNKVEEKDFTLFPVRRSFVFIEHSPLGLPGRSMRGANYYLAENPEFGAQISYYLKEDIKTLKSKRKKREADLIKDKKPVNYPSWDEMRKEQQEPETLLVFSIYDNKQKLVRRITRPAKKGFYRFNWDLRMPSTASYQSANYKENNSSGPLVPPGQYTVKVSKVAAGKETAYNVAQAFTVTALENKTFVSQQPDKDFSFDQQLAQLTRAVNSSVEYMHTLGERLDNAEIAIKHHISVPADKLQNLIQLRKDYQAIHVVLFGDTLVSGYSEPTQPGLTQIMAYLNFSRSETTGPILGEQRKRFNYTSERYQQTWQQLSDLDSAIDALEKALQTPDASWLPGKLPIKLDTE